MRVVAFPEAFVEESVGRLPAACGDSAGDYSQAGAGGV